MFIRCPCAGQGVLEILGILKPKGRELEEIQDLEAKKWNCWQVDSHIRTLYYKLVK